MAKRKFVKFLKKFPLKMSRKWAVKNAFLGEMYVDLSKKGLRIPNGFATTADAYRYFLDSAGLKIKSEKFYVV